MPKPLTCPLCKERVAHVPGCPNTTSDSKFKPSTEPPVFDRRLPTEWKQFMKHDQSKPRPRLLPLDAIEKVLEVLEYGAQKYSDENWRKCDGPLRYYDAALRHLFAYMRGEQVDPESGLCHLAHAACCVLFLLSLEHRNA